MNTKNGFYKQDTRERMTVTLKNITELNVLFLILQQKQLSIFPVNVCNIEGYYTTISREKQNQQLYVYIFNTSIEASNIDKWIFEVQISDDL